MENTHVGLDDTDDVVNLGGVDGKTSDDATETGVAGGDVGVGAVVDIQHESVGALDEDLVAAVLGLLHILNGIDGIGGELDAVLLEAGNLLLDIVLEEITESLLVAVGELSELTLKDLLVENLVNSDTRSLYVTASCQLSRPGWGKLGSYHTAILVL